jgi:hypothetical protein
VPSLFLYPPQFLQQDSVLFQQTARLSHYTRVFVTPDIPKADPICVELPVRLPETDQAYEYDQMILEWLF